MGLVKKMEFYCEYYRGYPSSGAQKIIIWLDENSLTGEGKQEFPYLIHTRESECVVYVSSREIRANKYRVNFHIRISPPDADLPEALKATLDGGGFRRSK